MFVVVVVFFCRKLPFAKLRVPRLERRSSEASALTPDRSCSLGRNRLAQGQLEAPPEASHVRARPRNLELPGVAPSEVASQEPTSMSEAMEPKASTRSQAEVGPSSSKGKVSSVCSQDSPKAGRVSSQSSAGREISKVRSRRGSIDLHRAVSKANLTEVFKLREADLTAELRAVQPSEAHRTPEPPVDPQSVLRVLEGAESESSQDEVRP